MQTQLDMFAPAPAPRIQPRHRLHRSQTLATERTGRRRTIEERCADFDAAHPEVYAEIRRLALAAYRAGRRRIGIGQLVEVVRWNLATDAADEDGYKVNNDYRAAWARRLVAEHPELAPLFELRARRSS